METPIKLKKRIIMTGASYGDYTYIPSGLKNGELIVDKGARRVVKGDEVELASSKTMATK